MEKDAYVSLRLPGALAEALERAAAERGTAPIMPRLMPAREFACIWESLPHLTPEEAGLFEADIRAARDSYPPEVDRWE